MEKNKNNVYVGAGNVMSDSFLGSEKAQKAVTAVGVLFGKNIAMLIKDKIEDDFENTNPAFRVSKPVTMFGIRTLSVIGMSIETANVGSYPIVTVNVVDTTGKQSELSFSPSQYFDFQEGMSDTEILMALSNKESGNIHERIFSSPYAASCAAQAYNRNELARVNDILSRYSAIKNTAQSIMSSIDAPFNNKQ